MKTTSSRPRVFAIIGAGMRAAIGKHISEIEPTSHVGIVVDPDPKGIARGIELFGEDCQTYSGKPLQTFSSIEAMLEAQEANPDSFVIDGALICSPDYLHAQQAKALLNKGIPVYLEKPMAIMTENADAILTTAKRNNTIVFVGHNMRYMAVVKTIKKIIDDGLIGTVQAIWCRHFVGHGGDFYFRDWHAERNKSNSLLLQKGIHDLDVIHYLAGSTTKKVQGFGRHAVYQHTAERTDRSDTGQTMQDWFSLDHWPPNKVTGLHPTIEVEDISQVNLQLHNGITATYSQCHFTPDYWRNYTVIGDEGRLENFGDTDGGVVRVWNKRHNYTAEGDLEFPIVGDQDGHGDADKAIMADFLAVTKASGKANSIEPLIKPEAARDAVAVADYAARSVRLGGEMLVVPKALL